MDDFKQRLTSIAMVEVPVLLTEEQKAEIFRFDVLYRVNAQGKGEKSVFLGRGEELMEEEFHKALREGDLEITEEGLYRLSEKGRQVLTSYGKMFHEFKKMSIFKCVRPEAPPPEPGEPDERFGGLSEVAHPPESEDYRLLIFDNFCRRERRNPPLHLFVFFSLVENRRIGIDDDDWAWDLVSGRLFQQIEEVMATQPRASQIVPEGWTEDGIVDAIYKAGMDELRRCTREDGQKYNLDSINREQSSFWVEREEVFETNHRPVILEPYRNDLVFDNRPSFGAGLCVGAFAGLATCYLLS